MCMLWDRRKILLVIIFVRSAFIYSCSVHAVYVCVRQEKVERGRAQGYFSACMSAHVTHAAVDAPAHSSRFACSRCSSRRVHLSSSSHSSSRSCTLRIYILITSKYVVVCIQFSFRGCRARASIFNRSCLGLQSSLRREGVLDYTLFWGRGKILLVRVASIAVLP